MHKLSLVYGGAVAITLVIKHTEIYRSIDFLTIALVFAGILTFYSLYYYILPEQPEESPLLQTYPWPNEYTRQKVEELISSPQYKQFLQDKKTR